MVIAQIVEGFRQRGSWTKIQGIFKMCNLSTSRGWEETTKKLINEQDLNQDENFSEKIEQLFSYYNSFLLVSNKAVKLYSRERKIIDKWIASFKSHELEDNFFMKHEGSGQNFEIRHMPVILYFQPQDKSARKTSKKKAGSD